MMNGVLQDANCIGDDEKRSRGAACVDHNRSYGGAALQQRGLACLPWPTTTPGFTGRSVVRASNMQALRHAHLNLGGFCANGLHHLLKLAMCAMQLVNQ